MSLSDLKTYFRTVIKVLAGGPPVGTPGSNRAAGMLAALDKLAEFANEQAATPYTAGPGIVIDADHLISAATIVLELPLAQPQPAANEVAAPAMHAITGLWNGDTTDTTVYVFGLHAGAFASTGWVIDGAGVAQAVNVNVAAATWETQVDYIARVTGTNNAILCYNPDGTLQVAPATGGDLRDLCEYAHSNTLLRLNANSLQLFEECILASGGKTTNLQLFGLGCRLIVDGAAIGSVTPQFIARNPGDLTIFSTEFSVDSFGLIFSTSPDIQPFTYKIIGGRFLASGTTAATVQVYNSATLIVEDVPVDPAISFVYDAGSAAIILRGTTNGEIGAGKMWPVGTLDQRASTGGGIPPAAPFALCKVLHTNGYQFVTNSGFQKLTLNKVVLDNAGLFNATTSSFTVPAGQGGTYECSMRCRVDDNTPHYTGFGFGINKTMTDDEDFTWAETTANATRNGETSGPLIYELAAGDTVWPYCYLTTSQLVFTFITVIIKRIR